MTKKYSYTAKERKAEREIDTFLKKVGYNASRTSGANSVLDELREISGE